MTADSVAPAPAPAPAPALAPAPPPGHGAAPWTADLLPAVFNAAAYFVDRHLADGRGDHVAVIHGDEQVTYRQVVERVNRLGNALRATFDVRVEERVLLLLPDSPAFVYAFFGAMKIGAVPVPANTLLTPADYEYLLNDSRARVVIVGESLLPRLQAIPPERLRYLRSVVVDGQAPAGTLSLDDLLASGSPDLAPEPTSKDDAAFWLYSSGSTGLPKGCVHLHHDMLVCTELYARPVLGIGPRDRCFSVAKLFFAYGLGNALCFPFGVGATTILLPGPPTPSEVAAVVTRHRPTLFFSVPTAYAQLLAADLGPQADALRAAFADVRWAVSAGESLPPAIFERFAARFGVTILDGIGSTEVGHIFISNRAGAIRPGSSGVLVPGYEARLLDEGDQPVPDGEVGNLLVKGDSTCAGYWNKHEKTKDTIEGHWIRTGDKYRRDGDGFYWYAGRSDDMLKVGGIWVSPVEVENCLVEHPAVRECAVVGREDEDRLTKPLAFVVLAPGHAPSAALADDLQAFVRDRLAAFKRPRWVEFVPDLPRTATGKTQRYKLRALLAAAGPGGRVEG